MLHGAVCCVWCCLSLPCRHPLLIYMTKLTTAPFRRHFCPPQATTGPFWTLWGLFDMPGGSLARLHLGAALQQVGKASTLAHAGTGWLRHVCWRPCLLERVLGKWPLHPQASCSASQLPLRMANVLLLLPTPLHTPAAAGPVPAGLLRQLHGHCRNPAGLAQAAGHQPRAGMHRWVGGTISTD